MAIELENTHDVYVPLEAAATFPGSIDTPCAHTAIQPKRLADPDLRNPTPPTFRSMSASNANLLTTTSLIVKIAHHTISVLGMPNAPLDLVPLRVSGDSVYVVALKNGIWTINSTSKDFRSTSQVNYYFSDDDGNAPLRLTACGPSGCAYDQFTNYGF